MNIAVVLATMFLLGTAETFADTTTSTLLPMIVEPDQLGIANSRLMPGFITANQLAGPPIGAVLFAVGRAWPFAAQGVMVALGAVLITKIGAGKPTDALEHEPARRQIAEGIRWLWRHPPIRTLTITIVTFNVTFGAAWSVLVLYTKERLGLGEIGFGLVSTVSAVGGIVGSWSYGLIERHARLGDVMRIGLIIETLTHASLALTTVPAVALVVFFVFGAHAAIWGTIASSIRQRAVPIAFQGRVGSVYSIGVMGGIVVGSALGGLIGRASSVTGPFWFAFVGSAIILACIWPALSNIAHTATDADERATV